MKKKYVVAGGKERGYLALKTVLNQGNEVVGVVIDSNEELDTKQSLKKLCHKLDIFCIQPKSFNDRDAVDWLNTVDVDVLLLAGYGKMVGRSVLSAPKVITINMHASPIPRYKGASPLNWMIINGESEFGVSILEVDYGVDSGPVLGQIMLNVKRSDDINTVSRIANEALMELLVDIIKQIDSNSIKRKEYREDAGFQMTRRFKHDGLILWDDQKAANIVNLVRALQPPYPQAFCYYKRQKIDLLKVSGLSRKYIGVAGRVAAHLKSGVVVIAADEGVLIEEVRLDGIEKKANDVLPKTGSDLVSIRNYIHNNLTEQ